MPGIITLLSDFGSSSPYPAQMKAVLASLCDATLIDITHDVPRHDLHTGAYLLSAMVQTTMAGSVHLAVVDPGVGTTRKPIFIISGGQFFVGPDNGLLVPAARRIGRPRVFEITAGEILLRAATSTFHGRDIFAPTAARLAEGAPPDTLGRAIETFVDLTLSRGRRDGNALLGEVLYVDAFGNLITSIPAAALPDDPQVQLVIGRQRSQANAVRTYGDVAKGAVAIVAGSDGLLEVAVREGSAAERFQARRGSRVRITKPRGHRG